MLILLLSKMRDMILSSVPWSIVRTGLYVLLLVLLIGTWSVLTYRMFRGIERRGLKEFQTQEELREHERTCEKWQTVVEEGKSNT